MSQPDRNNPYSFNEFLEWRKNVDYYADDPFIQKVVKHFCGPDRKKVDARARVISAKASFRWRDMAEAIAWPEKRPYMMHYDGHHNRIDRIVRPHETEIMEREVFGERLFSDAVTPWEKLIGMYIIYQNSEACIACPLTCTEGLVKLLEKYADTPETRRILVHCKNGIDGEVAIGAQYLSEIQGGSDVPANLLEAVEEEGRVAAVRDQVLLLCHPRGLRRGDGEAARLGEGGALRGALLAAGRQGEGDTQRVHHRPDQVEDGNQRADHGRAHLQRRGRLPGGAPGPGPGKCRGDRADLFAPDRGPGRGREHGPLLPRGEKVQRVPRGLRPADRRLPAGEAAAARRWSGLARRTTAGSFKLYSEFLGLEGGLKGGLVGRRAACNAAEAL